MKLKFKKIEDGLPDNDRDVLVLLDDTTMAVGCYYNRRLAPINVQAIDYSFGTGAIEFDSSAIAWAELPEVSFE